MMHCLYRVVLQFAFYCTFFLLRSYASPDSTGLPASLQRQLQELRQKDNLEQWLYARIDYVDAAPFERIDFLMATQQAAWRSYTSYDERLAWFNVLILQGYYQLQTGNILSSINAYETALGFYEAYPLPDADNINYVLKPLGNNYTRLADYSTALLIHGKILSLAQQQHNNREIAAAYSNMAICARWKGDLSMAMQYCREGIAKADHRTSLYGLLLSTSADVLTEQGRYDTASRVIGQALHHLQQYQHDTDAVYWYGSALQMAARIATLQEKDAAALQYARDALQLFDRYFPHARQREKAKVNVLLGDVCRKTGKPQEALQYYQRALRWLLPSWQPADLLDVPDEALLYSESTLADALAGKAAILPLLDKREAAMEHYIAVFAAGRKLRSAFYYTDSKLKELQLSRLRADAAMQLAYALWSSTQQKKYQEQLLLIAELSKAQVLAEERAARIDQTLRKQPADSITRKARQLQDAIIYYQHELAAAPNNKNIPALLQVAEYELSLLNKKNPMQDTAAVNMIGMTQLHHYFQRIPARVTVLEFFAGLNSIYVIEADNKGISNVRRIENSSPLQHTVQQFMERWFLKGAGAMMNAPKQYFLESYAIYKSLFAGYKWTAGQRYLLIPDGQFSYLPFDALVTNDQYSNNYASWPFLFRQAALSQAYSLQTWYQQQSATYAGNGFTGFFVSKGKGQPQPELSVMREYQSLQGMVRGDYYLDSMATWQAFTARANGTGVMHISTHGVSGSDETVPYLQLYDQPFYLFDLRYRHFAPALVVLGACKTADGEWLAGEGVNSLSRGFTAAGAGGVVSGLWNVNDEAAIYITQRFYEELQRGNDPALALHDAQQQWFKHNADNDIMNLPYYWAGFVYSGHLQPVPLVQQKQNTILYVITGSVLVAGLIFYLRRKRKKPL
ncbi:MAG: CHAT domain-containing protein [Niastella sp.]|nr:CHAT domain-containing protein [Niastella sp.]